MSENKKYLKAVDITVDACMDADDLGQRLVECVKSMDTNVNVVNLVKIRVGSNVARDMFPRIVEEEFIKPLKELGATNCIFVPLVKDYIEDITVDHIEVVAE